MRFWKRDSITDERYLSSIVLPVASWPYAPSRSSVKCHSPEKRWKRYRRDYWWTFEQAMVYVCKSSGKRSLELRTHVVRVYGKFA